MKLITANFLTCAIKSCKTSQASFPLHFRDAELEQQDLDFQPDFVRNVLPRIHWESLRVTAKEVRTTLLPLSQRLTLNTNACATQQLGFDEIPETKPEGEDEEVLKDLHRLLLETHVMEGKLVCGNCGHEYRIKDGIANFLLPSHLGMEQKR